MIRTARKEHPCDNAKLAERREDVGAVCRRVIPNGEQYHEGEIDPYRAGGFGHERYCLGCLEAGFV